MLCRLKSRTNIRSTAAILNQGLREIHPSWIGFLEKGTQGMSCRSRNFSGGSPRPDNFKGSSIVKRLLYRLKSRSINQRFSYNVLPPEVYANQP